MNNYDDYENNNELIEQENQGQAIDPNSVVDTIENARAINDRIQQSKLKNNGEIDVKPKVEPKVDPATGAKTAGDAANAASGASGAGAGTAAGTGAASSTAAGTGATAASAGAGAGAGTAAAGTTAAAGSTAAAGASTAGATATGVAILPIIGWVALGILVLVILLIIFDSLFVPTGNAIIGATGSDEYLLVEECNKYAAGSKRYEKCVKIREMLKGESSAFGDPELFQTLLDYCDDEYTFGQKIERFFTELFTGDPVIKTSCDLAKAINKFIEKKEEEKSVSLSRGLAMATFQLLYSSKTEIEDDSKKVQDNSEIENHGTLVDTASINNLLNNMAIGGAITARDIRSLIDYMVYDISYTSYNWEVLSTTEECDRNGENCITHITYGCKDNKYEFSYPDLNKYLLFLRFGGSYFEVYNTNLEKNKSLWNRTTVENGFIKIKKQELKSEETELEETIETDFIDPATSYQEINNYNEAYEVTSDECKIEGRAEESLPEDTDDTKYHLSTGTVDTAVTANQHGIIDTTAYEVDAENVTEPKTANIVKSGCYLNHFKSGDLCAIEQKELNYVDGFIYMNYPKYYYNDLEKGISKTDITGKSYINLGKSIESDITQIDDYEDYLNEIFGFDKFQYGDGEYIPGMFGGSGTSTSCLEQENLKIRLMTCSGDSNAKQKERSTYFPGGRTPVNGVYVANNTISLDEYIKGVSVIEFGGSRMTSTNLEALKFQLIAQKSYLLRKIEDGSSRLKTENGELYIPVGSSCFQNFGNVASLSSSQRSILNSAYDAIKNTLFYETGTSTISLSEYGSTFTQNLMKFSAQGLTYEQILNQDYVRNYMKDDGIKYYKNSELKSCSTTTQLGHDFVSNAAAFLKGGSGPAGGWMNKNFINSQYQSIGDFKNGSAWCAKFTNLIKELTPNVAAKIGNVPSFGGVKYWMRHFAGKSGLKFCASDRYASVGCYTGGVRYSTERYTPKAGDLIFYAYTSLNGRAEAPWNGNPLNSENQDHIGIIANVYKQGDKTCIDTIEGNVGGSGSDGNSVRYYKCVYYTSHTSIAGYGIWE